MFIIIYLINCATLGKPRRSPGKLQLMRGSSPSFLFCGFNLILRFGANIGFITLIVSVGMTVLLEIKLVLSQHSDSIQRPPAQPRAADNGAFMDRPEPARV